jgi:hypothetical protein
MTIIKKKNRGSTKYNIASGWGWRGQCYSSRNSITKTRYYAIFGS